MTPDHTQQRWGERVDLPVLGRIAYPTAGGWVDGPLLDWRRLLTDERLDRRRFLDAMTRQGRDR